MSPLFAPPALNVPQPPPLGEGNFPYWLVTSAATASMSAGTFRGAIFVAQRTELVSTLTATTGGTAAAATPTLCRYGVYTVAADGTLTLVASTPNDTAMFATTFTQYPRALSVPFTKAAGQRYVYGALVVTAAAVPVLAGCPISVPIIPGLTAPVFGVQVTALADLPATGTIAAAGGIVPFMWSS